jgi:hypothetical protein
MTARRRLPNRRASTSFAFECGPHHYIATISYFPGTDQLAEIFLGNDHAGSDIDAAAKDSAVVASIALQHGVPVDVIRHALLRDAQGRAASPPRRCAGSDYGAVMSKLTTFIVTLRALPGSEGIRGLRALLKAALRRHRLRAIDIREHARASRRPPAPVAGRTQARREGDGVMDMVPRRTHRAAA